MNKLDEIYKAMMRHDQPPVPIPKPTHLCVGCGELVANCKCDPTGETQYQSELRFRQEVKKQLKEIEEKLDLLIEAWVNP